jgi:hypothetical protein
MSGTSYGVVATEKLRHTVVEFCVLLRCVHIALGISPVKSTGYYMYHSTFCPHSVFMCSVWISEQTPIISLYSIN